MAGNAVQRDEYGRGRLRSVAVALATWFVARPALALAIWAALTTFGFVAYSSLMPREAFPAVDSPVVVANGRYLAGSATAVDRSVANLVGTAAIEFGGAETTQSIAHESAFSIWAEFPDHLRGDAAVDAMWESIFISQPPDEVEIWVDPVRDARFLDLYELVVAVHTRAEPTTDDRQAVASSLAELLDDDPAIEVAEVVPAVFTGREPDSTRTVREEVGFTLFAARSGDGSLAVRPSAAIGIVAADGIDAIELTAAAEAALTEATPTLPDGYSAEIALDLAPEVERQISSLQANAVFGLVAVLAIALPLIAWRSSLVTAAFLGSVLATSFGVLWLLGITLNTVSLLGIIIALGLLVDDAVVVADAIEAEAGSGAVDIAAVRNGVEAVATATAAGTFTTILVFAPMLAITGVLGDFVRILPITVITVLTVSLLMSLAFVPVALTALARLGRPDRSGQNDAIDRLASALADRSTRHPWWAAALAIAFTAAGLVVFAPRAGFNIFPPADDAMAIEIELSFPAGTDLDSARDVTAEVQQRATDALGDNAVGGFTSVGSVEVAKTQIDLTEIGSRPTASELIDSLLKPIAATTTGARVDITPLASGPPVASFPFRVQVFDDRAPLRLEVARAIADELEGAVLSRSDGTTFGVDATNVEYVDSVSRRDANLFVEVQASFDADDVSSVLPPTQDFVESRFDSDRLASFGLAPDALGFDFGEESDNDESFDSMNTAFVIALALIVVLLIALFRSSSHWLLMLLAIPFSFFGVFGGLLLTNNPISFFAMLGVMGLIGIAVNNTILLTDWANARRRAGDDPREAIRGAVSARFRPLVVTTATSIAAVLPLALRDPFWEALGMTLAFGLASSTLLVLVSFPAFYVGLERLRSWAAPPWRRSESRQSLSAM